MRSPAQKKMHQLYYEILRPLFTYHQINIYLFTCIDGQNLVLDVNGDQYFITSLEMLEACLSELQHAREIRSYNQSDIDYSLIGDEIELHTTGGVAFIWGLSTEINPNEIGYEIIDYDNGLYDLVLHTITPLNTPTNFDVTEHTNIVYTHTFESLIRLKKALDKRENWSNFENNEVEHYIDTDCRRIDLGELKSLIIDEIDMLEGLYPTE